jgi:hypothetical protein
MTKNKLDSNGLELTKQSLRLLKLEGQVRGLQLNAPKPEDWQARANSLKELLGQMKIRNDRGDIRVGDPYRKIALEVELGKMLLLIDGTL